MSRIPVLVAYGTRPEAIKMAPVIQALHANSALRPVVVVSGQHREMLDQVHHQFGITPDINLDLMSPGQDLATLTSKAISGFSEQINAIEGLGAVFVQGDTTSAMAAALAAFYATCPVVHLEAGLRSNNRSSPFPEEINRRTISLLADLHLAPTTLARDRLLREGHQPETIHVTGNTVIDALRATVHTCRSTGNEALDQALDQAAAEGRRIVLVTAHRREAWGDGLTRIARAVAEVAASHPDTLLVLPAHRNPVVRASLLAPLAGIENVIVTEPLEYGPFCHLLSRAYLVLTDSGGIQEEAPALGVPVLVMRDTTERPEAVAAGAAVLVGTETEAIADAAATYLSGGLEYERARRAGCPYGDGEAARRTVAAVEELLGLGMRCEEFRPPLAG